MSIDLTRRDFIKILGGATVATALPGCVAKKPQSLIPYVIPHEEIVPGQAVWYASVCRECPAGCGIHVRVRDGRAVKIEGNPFHPVNRGALCARGQAALQGLYNPDRVRKPMQRTSNGTYRELSWDQALTVLVDRLKQLQEQRKGASLALMTAHATGALDALADELLKTVGSNRRLRSEPIAYESLKRANEFTLGRGVIPSYHFADAEYILSFGADFLETWLSPVAQAKDFAAARELKENKIHPFVYVGPRLSMTAANADEWIASNSGTEGTLALGVVHVIMKEGLHSNLSASERVLVDGVVETYSPGAVEKITGVDRERITLLARSFAGARPGLAVSGGTAADDFTLHVAINLLNYVCGNVGETVDFQHPQSVSSLNSYADAVELVLSVDRNEVSVLLFAGVNPVFASPSGSRFADAIRKVPLTVAFSSFFDETTVQASLILPVYTELESWGDYEPSPGLHGLMQPVMQPVFSSSRMLGDVLLDIVGRLKSDQTFTKAEQPFLEYVKNRWRTLHSSIGSREEFDEWWVEALANGGVFSEELTKSSSVSLMPKLASIEQPRQSSTGDGLSLVVYPSPVHFDGRGANRPWLQELPDPMTMMTWENWMEIHPDDAKRLGVSRGDVVQLTSPHGAIELVAYPYVGVRQGTVAIAMGHGHTEYGRYAKYSGANVVQLLSPSPDERSGGFIHSGIAVRVVNQGTRRKLANVSGSDYAYGRSIAESITLTDVISPHKLRESEPVQTLYETHDHPTHRWGMTIDLDRCTGCGACVAACYAENNVPVVGKHQVEIGRELSWIRIERFFDDSSSEPAQASAVRVTFIPMLCQQCDSAPCEPVCPVYAAYHTVEGLNAQVYNRCVGTRYCSNNCPYKVRRFNWFEYEFPDPLTWQLNPDVTVRSKGVMEKCTFCIQRIVEGKMNARKASRNLRDGDIIPACQQSCPTQAIVFGDLKDPNSRVNRLREEQKTRSYRALEELNTQPAITYLKDIRS